MCEQLNNRRLREKQETIESANIEGSADEVLRDFCRDSFRDCHPAVREFVEQRLVSGAGIRQSVNMETAEGELRTAGVPQPEKVLRILVDRRLLTVEDRGGISRLELTHDILAPVIVRSRNSGTSETTLQAALDVYASLSDASAAGQSMDQRLAERLFRSLAQFGPTGETVRRQPSLSLAALAAEIGEDLEKTISVAEKFSNRGILVLQPAGTPAEPDSTVDVEHRALFSDSRLLAGWITQETQDAEDFRGLLKLQRDGVQVLDSQSLERAVRFFDRVRPTAAWARRWLSATASEAGAAQSLRDCQQLIEKSRQFRNRVVKRRRLWIAAVLVFLIGAIWFWQAERARQESINVTQRYLANPAAFLEELKQHQQVAVPLLQEQFAKPDPAHPEWQLHAAWGLARYQPTEQILQWLTARVPKLSAEQFRGTAQALQDVLSKLNRPAPTLVKEQLAAAANNRKIELRWLLMGLALGETQRLDRYCRAKPDPSDTTQLMLDLPTVPIDVVWLSKILDPASSLAPETRYLLCLVVGGLHGNAVAAEKSLEAVFIDAKDPGSHAAARWALLQQGRSADELEKLIADRSEAAAKDAGRDWYITPPLGPRGRQVPGLTMVRIPSHPEFILGSVTDSKDPSEEDWREWGPNDREPVESFWMSDREISNQQILAVLEDDAAWATKEPRWQQLREQLRQIYRAEEFNAEQLPLPVDTTWYNAVACCSLFSVYEGLEPAYSFAADAFEVVGGSLGLRARAGLVQPAVHLSEGNGYRLPLEREWEYACRTLSSSEFAFGNGDDRYRLDLHAVWDNRPLVPSGSLRPSRWGMFDLYGSTSEWCADRLSESSYGTIEIRRWLTQQLGGDHWLSRVLRGGSFDYYSPDNLRSANRDDNSPVSRSNNDGFRFSRTK
jgi:formylglycine-generating enzyme required for sulfatase activity